MSSRLKENNDSIAARMTFDLAARVERLEKSQDALLLMLAESLGKNIDEIAARYHKHCEHVPSV